MKHRALKVPGIDGATNEIAKLNSVPFARRTRIEIKNAQRFLGCNVADLVGCNTATVPRYVTNHMVRGTVVNDR